jgi:hypothetical protein
MIEENRELHNEKPPGHVYFIRCGDKVKIGYSARPMDRLKALQTAHPEELQILRIMPGDQRTETRLHYMFRQHRVRGEWFLLAPEILQYIKIPEERPRRQRPPVLPEVTKLLRLRRKHGANTAIGHHISILTEALPLHHETTNFDQKRNLTASIVRTSAALESLLKAAA